MNHLLHKNGISGYLKGNEMFCWINVKQIIVILRYLSNEWLKKLKQNRFQGLYL